MAATTLAMRRVWASLSAASLPISSATTRKAAPWVPARAASIVAFRASSLVLSATSLMTPEKVAISASCSARRSMRSRWAPMASTASTTRARTAAPLLDLGGEVAAHARGLLARERRVLGAAVQRLDRDGHALELGADVMHARGHRRGAHRGAGAAAAEGEDGAMDAADHVGDGGRQLGELVGGVGVARGRHGGEVPARVRELDLGLGREGGVQHGLLIGQKWAEV